MAALAGTIPLAVCAAMEFPGHSLVTALLLGLLFLGCVRTDRVGLGVAVIGTTIASHSALAILLSALDPTRTAAVLPGAGAYWQQTYHWVRTGEDPEYVLAHWLPAHVSLVAWALVLTYTSLGVVPFAYGIEQVDLMNYYVGRLIVHSQDPVVALTAGWHPWSVLRGLSFAVLVFEVTSLSLERLTGRQLSTARRRWGRWLIGLGLGLADGLVKYGLLDTIRGILFGNLLPESL